MKPQRGRPVGTGIDDRARLDAIRAHLASRPGMRPTTAIRALGHTDPSVIRRLRDKLKASAGAPGLTTRRTGQPRLARACAARSDTSRRFRISEAPPPSKAAAATASLSKDPLLAGWLELVLGACASALTLQQVLYDAMLKHPLVRASLHQQIAANELALSLLRVPASPSRRF